MSLIAAPQEEHPSRTSYVNLPVNEYIGSKVFAASGIPTQDVILGDYKGRSVVACRDFMYEMDPNLMLLHFKQLEISMPGGSSRSKARPDWEFVSQVLDEHDALEGIRARGAAPLPSDDMRRCADRELRPPREQLGVHSGQKDRGYS